MINITYITNFAAQCTGTSFFGFPPWYEYLNCTTEGNPEITGINDLWLIAAAGLEMIAYAAGVLAVAMFIYGGFVMMISQGSPDRVSTARGTMLNAAVGLAIAVSAYTLINLVARVF